MIDIGPGDRVEYLGGCWNPGRGEVPPIAGSVYTVREIGTQRTSGRRINEPVIWLAEIINNPQPYYGSPPVECGYPTTRFRPLPGTETGMKIIRKALKDLPVGVEV